MSAIVGGVFALAGGWIVQEQTRKRDHEARLWTRRADAYVALMRWRMSRPSEEDYPNPYQLETADERWRNEGFPLLAEISLFAGPRVQELVAKHPYLFQSVGDFSDMKPGELASISREDVGTAPTNRRIGRRSSE